MKIQKYSWSCGSATIVNVFRAFGKDINELHAISAAHTVSAQKCPHCRELKALKKVHTCTCSVCKECERLAYLQEENDCISGTTEEGLINALNYFGKDKFLVKTFSSKDEDKAWRWTKRKLRQGHVLVACVDDWNHWATVIGHLGDNRVILYDSDTSSTNKKINGVHVLTKKQYIQRLKHSEGSMDLISVEEQ